MKRFVAVGGALSALTSTAVAITNGCADAVQDASSNYYCEPAVTTLKYTGVGGSGSYSTVSSIDSDSVCSWTEQAYSGTLAPYDEEIAIIFRGPLTLRQFAAYSYDESSASKTKKMKEKRSRPSPHERRHGHEHFHKHQKEVREIQERAEAEKRAVGDMVTATIDGQVVSWVNTWSGSTAAAAVAVDVAVSSVEVATSATTSSYVAAETSTAAVSAASATGSSSSDDSSDSTGPWKRISYYSSEEKTKEGLTFLTHPAWTSAVAFAGSDGISEASDSTCFAGELANADEMFIMTDSPCSEDIGTECAYFKDGDQAFHGFGGTKKAFFFEFQMPDSGTHCSVSEMADKYTADNMPAIWSLNAKIMTDQYGCNCQATGCGELDFLEVLNPGNNRMKSTFHANTGFNGGDSHYIARPFDYYMSAIALFHDDTFIIKVLPNNTEAPASLTEDYVNSIIDADSDSDENIIGELAIFAMSLFS